MKLGIVDYNSEIHMRKWVRAITGRSGNAMVFKGTI